MLKCYCLSYKGPFISKEIACYEKWQNAWYLIFYAFYMSYKFYLEIFFHDLTCNTVKITSIYYQI